jgi:hypothetical protein
MMAIFGIPRNKAINYEYHREFWDSHQSLQVVLSLCDLLTCLWPAVALPLILKKLAVHHHVTVPDKQICLNLFDSTYHAIELLNTHHIYIYYFFIL